MKRILFLLLFSIFICNSLVAQTASFNQTMPVKLDIFPGSGMGHVDQVVFHPTDSNIIFAVSWMGGVWRSGNKGASWEPISDQLPASKGYGMAINPGNPDIMYLLTDIGLWKTANGGKAWSLLDKSTFGFSFGGSVIVDPTDTATIVVATLKGIYKSRNSGASWKNKSKVADTFSGILAKPGGGRSLYAWSSHNYYVSNDFGETWKQRNLDSTQYFIGAMMAVTPADSNLVYAFTIGSNRLFGGLFRSTDGGTSFKMLCNKPNITGYSQDGSSLDGLGPYNMAIAADPKRGGILYIGGVNIWKSIDSGHTFKNCNYYGTGVHCDKHGLAFSPFNNKDIYVNHDGGVSVSHDSGSTWISISDGLCAAQFYTLGQSVTRREICVGGLQDNGVQLYDNRKTSTIDGGDGVWDYVFDPSDTDLFYVDNLGERESVNTRATNYIGFLGKISFSNDSNVAYCGQYHLLQSKNMKAKPSSIKWAQIGDSTGTITSISISKKSNNLLYYISTDLYRCDNALALKPTFTKIKLPSTINYTPSQVIASPFDTNTVYISASDLIYVSSDKGKTWTNISIGLPTVNIIKFLIDEYDPDTGIYAATYISVYYRNNKLKKWKLFSASMPTVASTMDMEIYNDSTPNSCLRVATYGRGVWQSSLYRDLHRIPRADFEINSSAYKKCSDVYYLNDLSQGAVTKWEWYIYPNRGYKYINGTDSTSKNPELLFTGNGYYQVSLKASNPGGSSIATRSLRISPLNIASGCAPKTSFPGNKNSGIARFELNDIDNSPTSQGNDFSCEFSTVVRPGGTYTSYVTTTTYSYSQFSKLYIDYNNNGVFTDPGEAVGNVSGFGRQAITFIVPKTGFVKDTFLRMRIVSDNKKIAGPCNKLDGGNYQDYSILIDTIQPVITVHVPDTSSSTYKAIFTSNIPVSGFDSSMIKITNATLSNFRQTDPQTFVADIRPQINSSWIAINILRDTFRSLAGVKNMASRDSTYFFLGFKKYDLSIRAVTKSVVNGVRGDNYSFSLPYLALKNSLVSHFILSDTSTAYIKGVFQKSDTTSNDFTNAVIYKIVANDTSLYMMDTVAVDIHKDTSCLLIYYGFKTPLVSGKIFGDSINVFLPTGTNVTRLIANYKTAATAKVTVNGTLQQSDTTVNDFTNIVPYMVTAQDTAYHKLYNISIKLVTVTGELQKGNQSDFFSIYPVPVHDFLYIDFTTPVKNILLGVYDASGKFVLSRQSLGNKKETMDMSSLPKGTYYLHVNSNGQGYSRKVIKE